MILTCPNCASRFLLPARALAPSGRRVRCSSCSSKWFQLPDPDELPEDLPEGAEHAMRPIPESIRPESFRESPGVESSADPDYRFGTKSVFGMEALQPFIARRRRAGRARSVSYLGYGAAALVFLAILTVFVVLRPALVKHWPPSAVLYEMMGLPVTIPGEGMAFDRVSARTAGDQAIEIEGQIINLTLRKQKIPRMEATLESEEGEPVARWTVEPPAPVAGAEAVLPFKTRYEGSEQDIRKAGRFHLRFIMEAGRAGQDPKTASEDGGNIQAPPADGSGPPPGGESH